MRLVRVRVRVRVRVSAGPCAAARVTQYWSHKTMWEQGVWEHGSSRQRGVYSCASVQSVLSIFVSAPGEGWG